MVSGRKIKNRVVQIVLKAAWERFGRVTISEVDAQTLSFEFQNDRDREQIMDLSSWSVNNHCYNLKACNANMSVEELDFTKVVMWAQIQGLSLDMLNAKNAECIGSSIGRCVSFEEEHLMRQRTFLRVQLEIDITVPLLAGFWWVNSNGQEKWAKITYERILDLCFGCGRIGHTSHHCEEKVLRDETDQDNPRYEPWTIGVRPRLNTRKFHVGVGSRPSTARAQAGPSWRDVMLQAMEVGRVNPQERRRHLLCLAFLQWCCLRLFQLHELGQSLILSKLIVLVPGA